MLQRALDEGSAIARAALHDAAMDGGVRGDWNRTYGCLVLVLMMMIGAGEAPQTIENLKLLLGILQVGRFSVVIVGGS